MPIRWLDFGEDINLIPIYDIEANEPSTIDVTVGVDFIYNGEDEDPPFTNFTLTDYFIFSQNLPSDVTITPLADGRWNLSMFVSIPPIKYGYVENVEEDGTQTFEDFLIDVPLEFDYLTLVQPDTITEKTFSITIEAEETDNLVVNTDRQTYTFKFFNNWDGDKQAVADLLLRER